MRASALRGGAEEARIGTLTEGEEEEAVVAAEEAAAAEVARAGCADAAADEAGIEQSIPRQR